MKLNFLPTKIVIFQKIRFQYISFSILLLLLSQFLSAQNDSLVSTDHTYLRLKTENDYFKLGEKSDKYFSNGVRIEYQFPQSLQHNGWLRKIFPVLPDKSYRKTKLGATFGMNMYTPADIKTTIINTLDRPYAGWAYLGLSGMSNNFSTGERATTEFNLGVIGPASRQKELQKFVHRIGNKIDPQGWDNQIANDLALNVNFLYEKILFSPVNRIETIALMEVNAGTVTNYLGVGGTVRFGRFNDYFFNASGLKMKNKDLKIEKLKRSIFVSNLNRDLQHYFFVRTSFRFALNNSLLQGGIFTYYKSPYVLSDDALERFYFNGEFGYTIVYKKLGFTFSQFYRSAEFKTSRAAQWGSISLLIGMGG
jgi:lipid A 3-O-deacylase